MSPPDPVEPPSGPNEPSRPTEPTGPDEPSRPTEPAEPAERVGPVPPAGPPRWDMFAVVAVGGALGAAGRYGLILAWPHAPDGFPWATLVTNLSGCALIGVLMQLVTARTATHRLIRPFFGTGLLGGYTTFSTYAVEIHGLFAADRPGPAIGYLLGTLAGALGAVRLGMWAADRVPMSRTAGGAS